MAIIEPCPIVLSAQTRGELEFRLPITTDTPHLEQSKLCQMLLAEVQSKSHRGRHVSYQRRHIALHQRSSSNMASIRLDAQVPCIRWICSRWGHA